MAEFHIHSIIRFLIIEEPENADFTIFQHTRKCPRRVRTRLTDSAWCGISAEATDNPVWISDLR